MASDRLEQGLAALRRLNRRGVYVNLFRTIGARPWVRVNHLGVEDGVPTFNGVIDLSSLEKASRPGVVAALKDIGWAIPSAPTSVTQADDPPTYVTRTYHTRSDADLIRIATDAQAALDVLLPRQSGQPLNGKRFGPYSPDSEWLFLGCGSSLPSLLLGLVVGSVILWIWFPSDWASGPAWGAAILVAVLGSAVTPAALVRVTKPSDSWHDAAEAIQTIGLMVLPAVIGGIALVVGTTAY